MWSAIFSATSALPVASTLLVTVLHVGYPKAPKVGRRVLEMVKKLGLALHEILFNEVQTGLRRGGEGDPMCLYYNIRGIMIPTFLSIPKPLNHSMTKSSSSTPTLLATPLTTSHPTLIFHFAPASKTSAPTLALALTISLKLASVAIAMGISAVPVLPIATPASTRTAWKIASIRSSTKACGPSSFADILRCLEVRGRGFAVPPPFLRLVLRETFMKRRESFRAAV